MDYFLSLWPCPLSPNHKIGEPLLLTHTGHYETAQHTVEGAPSRSLAAHIGRETPACSWGAAGTQASSYFLLRNPLPPALCKHSHFKAG